jgi:hypothetical protein
MAMGQKYSQTKITRQIDKLKIIIEKQKQQNANPAGILSMKKKLGHIKPRQAYNCSSIKFANRKPRKG